MTDRKPHDVTGAFDVRPPRDLDEAVAAARVLSGAFNFPAENCTEWIERMGMEHYRIIRDADDVLGGLLIIPMGQYFGGRSVSMAGIAAVGIAPEHRARGAATALMRQSMRDLHDQGFALSALYPATQPLYRRAGFEQAGGLYDITIPAASIHVGDRAQSRAIALRRINVDDERDRELMKSIYARFAASHNGPLDRAGYIWSRVYEHRRIAKAEGFMTTDANDDTEKGSTGGYVLYARKARDDGGYDLALTDFIALDHGSAQRLWSFLADHRSMVRGITWQSAPQSRLLIPLMEQAYTVKLHDHWMLRIIDVRKALEGRGYPRGIDTQVHIEVTDDAALPDPNVGCFTVSIGDGSAQVETAHGRSHVRLPITSLAPLYSGFLSPFELRAAGMLAGDDESLAALQSIFAGPTPWMADSF